MSRWDIPTNWEWTAVGEVAEILGGGTPSVEDESNFDPNGIPWITPADLSGFREEYVPRGRRSLSAKGLEISNAILLPAGTVLFTSRAPIGYCAIAANDLATNQGFKNFILFGGINPRYVRFYLLGSRDYAESLASGTTFKELSQSRAAKLELPIAPLVEQERVVRKVDALQERSRNARDALDAIEPLVEQFRRSALAKAFRGEFTSEWRADHPAAPSGSELIDQIREQRRQYLRDGHSGNGTGPAAAEEPVNAGESVAAELDTAGLPPIPERWAWAAAEEIVEPGSEIVYGILQPGENVPDGVLYVQARDIHDGVIQQEKLARTRPAIAKAYERSSIQGGDVLLGIIRATKVTVVPNELSGIGISRGLARFRPSPIIRTEYLARWLASPLAQDWLHRRYRGIDMPGLNLRDVRRLPVPIAPLGEQAAIAQRLAQVAAPIASMSAAAREAHTQCDSLDQAIFGKAFRGKLTVQSDSEEPGTAVVARARQERAAALAARRTAPKRRGAGKMKPTTTAMEDVRKWVSDVGRRAFSFDELRRGIPHKYEDVKQAVFELLGSETGVLTQFFDESEKQMKLRGSGR